MSLLGNIGRVIRRVINNLMGTSLFPPQMSTTGVNRDSSTISSTFPFYEFDRLINFNRIEVIILLSL